ncbi:hypothetical protein [Aerococcus sp. L_32]|uniref:hypothetical protein n=1 Tax=Aerococcus sp. L_32 TaxID=3422316 RepID=UPI003D6C0EB7
MNIQERIEALETEFAEKIKALKAEVQQVDEFPQYKDTYYYIQSSGRVDWLPWVDDDIGLRQQGLGNVFRTIEQAEFAVEKLKVETELRKFSRPVFKEDEDNYFIQINASYHNLVVDTDEGYQTQGAIYFESRAITLQAIETVGEERIKKYIFGVEELNGN